MSAIPVSILAQVLGQHLQLTMFMCFLALAFSPVGLNPTGIPAPGGGVLGPVRTTHLPWQVKPRIDPEAQQELVAIEHPLRDQQAMDLQSHNQSADQLQASHRGQEAHLPMVSGWEQNTFILLSKRKASQALPP
eukprot:TRINITY_DN44472_c0_g1_i1.p2 TRINITY_DN44472_c0_g1~~TRINITY_DN44472_c0_g1_i1.p2  ORF type:complete len:134 (-),score=14.44 TRINITY_DN44472_c0_g1_i1:80-481(-)